MPSLALDDKNVTTRVAGRNIYPRPTVKFDMACGTMVGLASLVSFSPHSSSDPSDSFYSALGHVTPTIVGEIDEAHHLKFSTPVINDKERIGEPPVYVEFLEDFDSAEIEAIHLETSGTYGW